MIFSCSLSPVSVPILRAGTKKLKIVRHNSFLFQFNSWTTFTDLGCLVKTATGGCSLWLPLSLLKRWTMIRTERSEFILGCVHCTRLYSALCIIGERKGTCWWSWWFRKPWLGKVVKVIRFVIKIKQNEWYNDNSSPENTKIDFHIKSTILMSNKSNSLHTLLIKK